MLFQKEKVFFFKQVLEKSNYFKKILPKLNFSENFFFKYISFWNIKRNPIYLNVRKSILFWLGLLTSTFSLLSGIDGLDFVNWLFI